jgi:hypothetical protein
MEKKVTKKNGGFGEMVECLTQKYKQLHYSRSKSMGFLFFGRFLHVFFGGLLILC